MLKAFSKKTKKLVTKRTSSHKGDTDSQADTLNGSEQEATVADVWARPDSPENSVHKIVIGVDFGTTYTGVSYVSTAGNHSKGLADIKVVQNWPGPVKDADLAWKTPSRIAYSSDNSTLASNNWGFEVSAKHKAFAWMKLLLDSEQTTKYDDPSLTASEGHGVLRLPPGKTTVDVCADYLTEVARFAYEELKKEFGEDVVVTSPLEFWFTVPAVWSDRAKADTMRAVERAAKNAKVFEPLEVSTYLVPEPEAAAVATISDITQGGSTQQVKPGDSVLVCDCGGGTVDITAYQVVSIEPKLGFKELLVGTGGKCGSTYIDRLFIRWMKETFGPSYNNLGWEKRGPGSPLMKAFEGHKKDFGTSASTLASYEMPLVMQGVADSRFYNKSEGEVKIYHAEMKQFFDPVIRKILTLVQNQLEADSKLSKDRTIKVCDLEVCYEVSTAKDKETVILVGGFGDSRYLNDALRKQCESWSIRLICPKHPQAAIVRGAALSGLHNLQPSSRRARRHYGFSWGVPFNRTKHSEQHRRLDEWDNSYLAAGYMNWSLSKGDVVTEQTYISHPVHRTPKISDENLTFSINVYCCDLDIAPSHRDDEGVRRLVTFDVDLASFDLTQCERKQINGYTHVKVDYELRVCFGSKRGVLNFLCVYKGKDIGRVAVTFDGQHADGATDDDDQEDKSCCVM